ncbi:MAG: DUF2846 domain-containing protein [Succinivibrio sp.]
MKRILSLLTLAASLFIFSGCTSVYMAPASESAVAKEFRQHDLSKAQLYVYRPNHIVGTAIKKAIWIDGTYVGQLKRKTFLLEEIEPGDHVITTESEFGNNHILLQAEPGKQYFVRQNIKFGVFVAGASIRIVDEAQGKSDIVKDCELIEALRKPSVDIPANEIEQEYRKLKKRAGIQ